MMCESTGHKTLGSNSDLEEVTKFLVGCVDEGRRVCVHRDNLPVNIDSAVLNHCTVIEQGTGFDPFEGELRREGGFCSCVPAWKNVG